MDKSNLIEEERLLVSECVLNDRHAQKRFYDKYAPKMYALCLRYVPDSDEAKDLLQEGFIKIFRNLQSYRGDGSLEGWIRRIFVNTCIAYLRQKNKLPKASENEAGNVKDNGLSGVEALSLKEIQASIQSLSDGYRTVFNLYCVEGFNHKEIADMLSISEGTSKSQLARAKMALQKILLKEKV